MPPPSENSKAAPGSIPPGTNQETPEYSPEERSLLLQLAHESIERAFSQESPEVGVPSGHLAEPRGAFTTLYVDGQLRGCVGFVFPLASLYQTIVETARAAAFEDSRFPPLTQEELPGLRVSISVLSPIQPIAAEEVKVGRHGLLISAYGRRGLLLPQVPVEHDWDRETFLAQTCRKAGLPENAWLRDATIEAFTAEVFGDPGAKE